MERIKVGVLALQGAFREHIEMLQKCGVRASEIRLPGQLEKIDGLIIPGGESTTMVKLMKEYRFYKPLDDFYNKNKPIFGTCADGRQVESFEELLDLGLNKGSGKFKSVFIRAPKISGLGEDIKILARFKQEAVLVQHNNILACAFHPELTEDLRIHKYFIEMIKNLKGEK